MLQSLHQDLMHHKLHEGVSASAMITKGAAIGPDGARTIAFVNPIVPPPSSREPDREFAYDGWSPFGRHPETLRISEHDAELLRRPAAPLTIMFPVAIEE